MHAVRRELVERQAAAVWAAAVARSIALALFE